MLHIYIYDISRLRVKGHRLRTLGSVLDFLLIAFLGLSCMVTLVQGFAALYFIFSVINLSVTVSLSCV